MITRTIKYTASDGTEHDSPQAAATYELAASILQISGTFTPMHENMAEKLALNPEALRDALDTYLEDLEAHPDVDNRICAICDGGPGNDGVCLCGEERWVEPDPRVDHKEPPHPSGLVLTDKARVVTGISNGYTVYDWLAQGWTPARLHMGDSRHMDIDYASGSDWSRSGLIVNKDGTFQSIPMGDPEDPSTWRADPPVDNAKAAVQTTRGLRENLPVDHPQYCRPFGTRED